MSIRSDSDIQAALARVETCLREGRPKDAVDDLRDILAVASNHPIALCLAGQISIQLGDNIAALQALDLALAVTPDLAEARNARGAALQGLGRLDEAEAEFRRVVAALPEHPGALMNLAAALAAKGDVEGAEETFGQALILRPGDAAVLYNLGLLRLLKGEMVEGWRGFEYRHEASGHAPAAVRSNRPRWRGEGAGDKTLLVLSEQGLGDCIQFARFVPLAAAQVGRVVLELPEPLTKLFASLPGVDQVVARGAPLPDHDFHIPVMSLPAVIKGGKEGIPWPGPYVEADLVAVRRWRHRAARWAPGPLHVGLVWSGNPAHKRDAERSIPLSVLEPLIKVPGVSFHSLQVGQAAEQLTGTAFAKVMKPLFRRPYPFTEVAAAITAMDLVIGVDTSLIHLAGAMGRPIWGLVTHVPDWRWMLRRNDTPWYPSMRLFRQPTAGDWPSVAVDVADALAEFMSQMKRGR